MRREKKKEERPGSQEKGHPRDLLIFVGIEGGGIS